MRDDKVTIAKALAIVLMVALHGGVSGYPADYVGMFHMPLFFLMSGYCFKEKYLGTPVVFVKKRVVGLWWPFVKWTLVFMAFHNLFFRLNIYNDVYGFKGYVSHLYTVEEFVRRVIGCLTMGSTEQLLGGYWFLPQLLFASVICYILIKYVRNLYIGGGILLILTILASHYKFSIPYIPFRSLSFLSSFFFLFGHIYKKKFDNWDKWWVTILLGIIVGVGAVLFPTSMLRFTTREVVPYAICGCCGTIMMLNLSKLLSNYNNIVKRLMLYIGEKTMTILTWHFLSFKLVSLIIIGIYHLPIEQLAYFPIIDDYKYWWVAYLFAGLTIPLGIQYCYTSIQRRLRHKSSVPSR